MTSKAMFERLTRPQNQPPILSLRSGPSRSPSEYTLYELEPHAESTYTNPSPEDPSFRKLDDSTATMRPSPPGSWDGRTNSFDSASHHQPKPIFAGPPPPIASSRLLDQNSSKQSPTASTRISHTRFGITSPHRSKGTFFGLRQQELASRPDSIWRGLQRQEKAIEREIQHLLDLQATGLVAGSTDIGSKSQSDIDGSSETGSSTSFNIFYSTVSSPSNMISSLHVPMRSTPDGNVIPVRQPRSSKPLGLRSARAGLKRSMAAMAELKSEENAHVEAAIAQRKDALTYLGKMSNKKDKVYAELHVLEEDDKEPLGLELRDLGAQHESLTRDIHALEEKLVAMRNRRRWLSDKMEDVKNRREAGLSGYRAAGRDIDAEVQAFLRRPPITPLDLDVLEHKDHDKDTIETPGGVEFLKLRPERRTIDMARTWWQRELKLLERRKTQILVDQEALEEGARVWEEAINLVADFESSLRRVIKASANVQTEDPKSSPTSPVSFHLDEMDAVISELKQKLKLAEDRHWNLLICAIGAELEAFTQAQRMLRSTLGITPEETSTPSTSINGAIEHDTDNSKINDGHNSQQHDESDNEVPSDLLVSHLGDHDDNDDDDATQQAEAKSRERRESENNAVPAEFLV